MIGACLLLDSDGSDCWRWLRLLAAEGGRATADGHLLSFINRRGFKALKQMTKLLYCTLLRPKEALKTYEELLTYTKSAVTRNCQCSHLSRLSLRASNSHRSEFIDSEKSINNILDYVGGEGKGYGVKTDLETLEKFYEVTKKTLEESKNEVRAVLLDRFCRITADAPLPTAAERQGESQARQALARPQGVAANGGGASLLSPSQLQN